jgi:hypothetical protein
VRVNHRGLEIGMPEELLNGADVRALLQQVCCKRVTQCVTRRALRNARPEHRLSYRVLARVDIG